MPIIIYEQWHTRGDPALRFAARGQRMRVCGRWPKGTPFGRQALHGQEWQEGEGPYPPLHAGRRGCRCRRRRSRVEWTPGVPPPTPAGVPGERKRDDDE